MDRFSRRVAEMQRMYGPMIRALYKRYCEDGSSRFDRAISEEDLRQVSSLAIIDTIKRWNPVRGRDMQITTLLHWSVRRHLHRVSGIERAVEEMEDGSYQSYHRVRKQRHRHRSRRRLPRTISLEQLRVSRSTHRHLDYDNGCDDDPNVHI